MVRQFLAFGALAATVMTGSAGPAQAGFFTVERMRAMCRGEPAEPAQFSTQAAQRLLTQTYHDQCRFYLLGVADGYLQARGADGNPPRCMAESLNRIEVADALAEAVAARSSAGAILDIVRDVLRTRFGCG